MKKITILFFAFVMLTLFSCEDESKTPYEPFDTMQYGAYARLIGQEGAFFYTDPENSTYTFTVEFYDENNGAGIESYNWTVAHKNNVTGVTGDAVSIFGASKSSFGTSPDGLPSISFTVTLLEVFDALGYTIDDVNGGDEMLFDGVITTSDGRTFGSGNVGANVVASAPFAAIFTRNVKLLCVSDLAGTMSVSTVPWCGGDTWTGEAILTEVGTGEYETEDFSFGAYYPCYGPDATLPGGDLKLIDACNILSYTGASRWGETYLFNNVIANGNELILDWENDYGEAGVTTLTRQDGENWPPLTF